jgi:hypothetical protein
LLVGVLGLLVSVLGTLVVAGFVVGILGILGVRGLLVGGRLGIAAGISIGLVILGLVLVIDSGLVLGPTSVIPAIVVRVVIIALVPSPVASGGICLVLDLGLGLVLVVVIILILIPASTASVGIGIMIRVVIIALVPASGSSVGVALIPASVASVGIGIGIGIVVCIVIIPLVPTPIVRIVALVSTSNVIVGIIIASLESFVALVLPIIIIISGRASSFTRMEITACIPIWTHWSSLTTLVIVKATPPAHIH